MFHGLILSKSLVQNTFLVYGSLVTLKLLSYIKYSRMLFNSDVTVQTCSWWSKSCSLEVTGLHYCDCHYNGRRLGGYF